MYRIQRVPQALTFCAAAILGDLTGSLWLVPSEVVKVQMQVNRKAPETHIGQIDHRFPLDDLDLAEKLCTTWLMVPGGGSVRSA